MTSWTPISLEQLSDFIRIGASNLFPSEKHFFETIKISPEKWKFSPLEDTGGRFWVIGVIGQTVLWYNDIEEGFNISSYSNYGEINDPAGEQDEFEWAVRLLKSFVDTGNKNRKIGLQLPSE